jgi:hypothetical protein
MSKLGMWLIAWFTECEMVNEMKNFRSNELLIDLLNGYRDGLYTVGEVATISLELLGKDCSIQLWSEFPQWLKSTLIERVKNFDDDDENLIFGHSGPERVRYEMLQIKKWMLFNALI